MATIPSYEDGPTDQKTACKLNGAGYQLHVETSGDFCSIALSTNSQIVEERTSTVAKNHAEWLAPATFEMMKRHSVDISDLQYISINAGPGSYTGLRVGFSFVKGLSWHLNTPLIRLTTSDIILELVKDRICDFHIVHVVHGARKDDFLVSTYINDNQQFDFKSQDQVLGMSEIEKLPGSIIYYKASDDQKGIVCEDLNAVDLIILSQKMDTRREYAERSNFEPIYFKPPYITKSNRKHI